MMPFIKMNGAGNDFVIFDARTSPVNLTPARIRQIAGRGNATTKGCDQIIVMEPSDKADVFMRIYNADGSEVDACGNATRCVAYWIMQELHSSGNVVVETNAGLLECSKSSAIAAIYGNDGSIRANMGNPRFISEAMPLFGFDIAYRVDVGNPHVVFFADDLRRLDEIDTLGPQLQKDPLFAEQCGVNVTIAIPSSDPGNGILCHVWERGVGRTAACGTAACATAIAAIRHYPDYISDVRVAQHLKETNVLRVDWGGSLGDPVYLTGPVKIEFSDEVEL